MQVNGRNAISWEERFEFDVWYVDHRSLRLDALILMRTIGRPFDRQGISVPGHATMPAFRGLDEKTSSSPDERSGSAASR